MGQPGRSVVLFNVFELRAERAWMLADRLRDRLAAAGIELRDTAAGPVWSLRPPDPPPR